MKTDKLKYKDEILAFSPNLDSFNPREVESFRFTQENINHPDNFKPVYILDPKRLKKDTLKSKATFRGYGLSLYENEEQAKKKYSSILRTRKTLHKKIGTHLAKGKVLVEHGVSDECNGESHFTLLENKDLDLSNDFTIKSKIYHG